MRVRIIIKRKVDRAKQREAAHRDALRSIFAELGYQVAFDERLPDRPVDPQEILLVDAREMQKELLKNIHSLAARKLFAHIIALTDKQTRTYRKQSLMQAGVEMIVPFDQPQLKHNLSIVFQELFGDGFPGGPVPSEGKAKGGNPATPGSEAAAGRKSAPGSPRGPAAHD